MPELTDLSYIRELCERHGFSFSKNFGQNFLVNPGICPRICETAGLGPQSRVLEIGPGFGTLTRAAAQRAEKVLALEVDRRLLPVLAETLADCPNAQVVEADALRCDLPALVAQHLGGGPVQVCANLPYYIASQLLVRLLQSPLPLTSATVMLQREMAERIAAKPPNRQCGSISYLVWYYAQPSIAFKVSPGSFYPPPKVTSAVLHLEMRPTLALAAQPEREERLFALVRASFGQRRKTLANAAAAGLSLPKEAIQAALTTAGLPAAARAESLSVTDYIALEAALWP